jgi:alkaline phosphatase
MHKSKHAKRKVRLANLQEAESQYWEDNGRNRLQKQLRVLENRGAAKNVIFFLGDGLSIVTQAAARTYKGQLKNKTGEETELFFETFPVSGLSKVCQR